MQAYLFNNNVWYIIIFFFIFCNLRHSIFIKYVERTSDVTSSHSSQVSENEDNPESSDDNSIDLIPSSVEKQETYISNDNNHSEEEEINTIEDIKYIEKYPPVEERLSRATPPTSDEEKEEDHLKSGINYGQEGKINTYMYF